jgi:hypothetical protein
MPEAAGTPLRAAALAAIVTAALALASVAAASKQVTVGAGSIVRMTGSDIYCTVVKTGASTTVACFHLPGGASSSKRKGWAIFGSDQYAGVTPPGTNTPKKLLPEPSFASVPKASGRVTKSQFILVGPGDLAPVRGTHMGIYVTKTTSGGDVIGVIYLGPHGNPVAGEITAGIGNQYVTLVKVSGSGSPSLIYRHTVY